MAAQQAQKLIYEIAGNYAEVLRRKIRLSRLYDYYRCGVIMMPRHAKPCFVPG